MDSATAKNTVERRSVDPVWTTIKETAQAAAANEPVLGGVQIADFMRDIYMVLGDPAVRASQ